MKFLFELFNHNSDPEAARQQAITLSIAGSAIFLAVAGGLGVRETNDYLDTACKDPASRFYTASLLCPAPLQTIISF